MLFAVLAIYDYYKYTNDADAKLLFDKGVNSIKKEVSKYNNNGYPYSYQKISFFLYFEDS